VQWHACGRLNGAHLAPEVQDRRLVECMVIVCVLVNIMQYVGAQICSCVCRNTVYNMEFAEVAVAMALGQKMVCEQIHHHTDAQAVMAGDAYDCCAHVDGCSLD